MPGRVLIDGNNVWHAMRALGPLAAIGRQQVVVVVDRWARQRGLEATVVFDGPSPGGGLEAQMQTGAVRTRFSDRLTADTILVEMIEHVTDAGRVAVVTSDRAILHAARARRCRTLTSVEFVEQLRRSDRPPRSGRGSGGARSGTPSPAPFQSDPASSALSGDEIEDWLDHFNVGDDNLPPYWQQG